MQGHSLYAGQVLSWTPRVRALTERAAQLQAVRDQAVRDLELRSREVETLSNRIEVLTKVGVLFQALMDRLVLSHVKSIESIVTEGLHTIFHDQELAFEAEVGQRYNRLSIDFYIRQESAKSTIRGRPLESFGGGPASLASLVLRILALLRLKRWPVLLLDETLAAISDEYVDQTGQFLERLATTMGLTILLVTHKQAFVDHATIAYSGSEQTTDGGERRLHLHRLRGTV
jgi:ABC-type dipeptide/oligopeptide/nickel transport system ATPase subunit